LDIIPWECEGFTGLEFYSYFLGGFGLEFRERSNGGEVKLEFERSMAKNADDK
jgi:hypothetical protein